MGVLHVAFEVDGTYYQGVGTPRGGLPGVLPAYPGEIGEGAFEGSNVPGGATIEADIDFGDAFIAGEGHAAYIGGLIDLSINANQRGVDTGSHADGGSVAPAALLPVALVVISNDFDTREPFAMLHAVDAGYQDADGETMSLGERGSVHMYGEEGGWFEGFFQVNAVAIIVYRVENDFEGSFFDTGTIQQVFETYTFPLGIAHILPTNLITDAHHRFVLFLHRQGQQFLVGQGKGMVHKPVDGQMPGAAINGGVGEEVFGDNIKLIIRGDLRGEKFGFVNCAIVRNGRRHDLALKMLYEPGDGGRTAGYALRYKSPNADTQDANARDHQTALQKSTAAQGNIFIIITGALGLSCGPVDEPILAEDEEQAKDDAHNRQRNGTIDKTDRELCAKYASTE